MLHTPLFRLGALLTTLGIALALALPSAAQTGTWTATTSASDYLETALLLTDGTVLVHSYGTTTSWFKLTPDAQGNYADGAFTQVASTALGRLYGPSAVLRDGRVFSGGGEYVTGTSDHNTCEIYDPVANHWTAGPDSLYSALGDTGSAILPDGRLLCSNWSNVNTDIYDPTTNAWTNAAAMTSATGDEETWISLADGTVLNTFYIGQRYIPAQNVWLPTGTIPVSLVDSKSEMGPALLLYDGRVLALGATGHTAFFTPPTTLTGAGTWAAGPDMPTGLSAPDTPACVEVNGKVLCVGTPTDFGATNFLEFDPAANTFTPVASPAGFNQVSDGVRMLALPNGQVLMTAAYQNAWVYTPVGGPQTGWAPTVASVAANGDGTFTVSGAQLNGLTNGAAYGDEANPYTHYPLVSLVDSTGNVHFARTFNFSQMNPSAPGAQQTAEFTLPVGLPYGLYNLYVTASGVASVAFPYTVAPPISPTTITAANASGGAGQSVTLNATLMITGGAGLSGKTVTFSVDGAAVGSAVTDVNGLAALPYTIDATAALGSHPLTASFAGDSGDSASSGTGTLTVTGTKANTTTTIINPTGASGQTVSLTARLRQTVSGTLLSGETLSFSVDGAVVGTAVTNSSGLATLHYVIPANAAAGAHPLMASFAGDSGNNPSSVTGTLTVTGPKANTTMTLINATGTRGQTVSLTARLRQTVSGTLLSGETLSFSVDGAVVGTAVTNSSGLATLHYVIPATDTVGSHPLVASFAGDSGNNASSVTGTLTVN